MSKEDTTENVKCKVYHWGTETGDFYILNHVYFWSNKLRIRVVGTFIYRRDKAILQRSIEWYSSYYILYPRISSVILRVISISQVSI